MRDRAGRHRFSLLRWCVVFLVLGAVAPAAAEEEPLFEVDEDDEGVALPPPRTAWLIVEGGLGVNGVTDDDYLEPAEIGLYPLVGLYGAAYVRPMEYLSAGVQLTYGLLFPHSEDVDVGGSGFLALSAFARGQYAFDRLEPWIAAGIGYALAHGSATGPRTSQAGTVSLQALAIDLSVGLAIEVSERITVGPFLRFVFGLWANGCQDIGAWPFDVSEDGCEDVEPLYGGVLPRLPHLWVVGANVAYWIL